MSEYTLYHRYQPLITRVSMQLSEVISLIFQESSTLSTHYLVSLIDRRRSTRDMRRNFNRDDMLGLEHQAAKPHFIHAYR